MTLQSCSVENLTSFLLSVEWMDESFLFYLLASFIFFFKLKKNVKKKKDRRI